MIREVRSDGTIDFGGAFTSIPRPRVAGRIREAASYRIALIVAPAGYGKSTALREHLTSVEGATVHFELAPEHANLLGFVRGFVGALGEAGKKSHKTLVAAFAESRDSTSRAVEMAAWLHSHMKGFVGTIAVDDLHLGAGDPQISVFLASLVERTRGRVRWIFASRSTLDLPVASWLAYGESGLTIDEIDLAFDLEEARRAARSARVAVRDDELQALLQLTGGWPTALAFALRSSTRSADLRGTEMSTREMIFRYLAEQVFRDLPAEMRDFMLTASLLPRLEIDVLNRAGYDRAQTQLEWLRNRVSFISWEGPGVYRIHDLFRDYLEYELRLLGRTATTERIELLARALEAAGRIPEALQMFVRAEAWPDVERLFDRHAMRLHNLGHVDVLEGVAGELPPAVRSGNPVVLGIRAAFEAERRRYDDAERLYARAIALAQSEALELRVKLSLQLAALRVNRHRQDASILLEPLLTEEALTADQRCELSSYLGCAYAVEARIADAQRSIERALELTSEIDNDELRARVEQHAGFVAWYAGDVDRTKHHSLEAATRASALGLYALASSAFSVLYTIYDVEEDHAQALWYAQQVASTAAKAGSRRMHAYGLTAMLEIEANRGNAERVADLESEIRSRHGAEAIRQNAAAGSALALRAAWSGDYAAAAQHLRAVPERITEFAQRRLHEAWLALYLAAAERRTEALEILGRLESDLAGESERIAAQARQLDVARAIGAFAQVLLGRRTIAQRWLRLVRDPDGPARPYVLAGRALAHESWPDLTALEDAFGELGRQGYGGHVRILRALAAVLAGDAEIDQPLTPGEIAVLRALAGGRTPKMIAQETGRSVNTISNHVRSAISKLRCHGRAEAIAIAQRRGFLGTARSTRPETTSQI